MSTTNAGERKRTVTVVIGPKTEAALLLWGRELTESTPVASWSLTDLVGVMLRGNMRVRIDNGLIDLPKTWVQMSE